MSSNGVSDEKRTGSEQSTDSNTRGPTWYDLTAFQQTTLRVLAEMDADDIDRMYGMEIKRRLEDRYETEINHGRLYPNLDDLSEMGLIEVGTLDRRTNSYELTTNSRRMLECQREEWANLSLPTVAMADGGLEVEVSRERFECFGCGFTDADRDAFNADGPAMQCPDCGSLRVEHVFTVDDEDAEIMTDGGQVDE